MRTNISQREETDQRRGNFSLSLSLAIILEDPCWLNVCTCIQPFLVEPAACCSLGVLNYEVNSLDLNFISSTWYIFDCL